MNDRMITIVVVLSIVIVIMALTAKVEWKYWQRPKTRIENIVFSVLILIMLIAVVWTFFNS